MGTTGIVRPPPGRAADRPGDADGGTRVSFLQPAGLAGQPRGSHPGVRTMSQPLALVASRFRLLTEAPMNVDNIHWLGHASFRIQDGTSQIYIDPGSCRLLAEGHARAHHPRPLRSPVS